MQKRKKVLEETVCTMAAKEEEPEVRWYGADWSQLLCHHKVKLWFFWTWTSAYDEDSMQKHKKTFSVHSLFHISAVDEPDK